MLVQLKKMWRGEIKLSIAFWGCGIAAILLFSFLFITIQAPISDVLGKTSNLPLYLDYFLVFCFLVYDIFILIVIWKSANKNKYSRLLSIGAIIIGIIFMLWFSGNFFIYMVIKTFITPDLQAQIDYVPEKIRMPASKIEAETLYLNDFKLSFPFYAYDIKYAFPLFVDHRMSDISIFLSDEIGKITFSTIDDKMLGKTPMPTFRLILSSQYARVRDFSWWNLPDNQALATKLILKAIAMPAFANSKVYDVETPHLHGYLRTGQLRNKYNVVELTYELNGKTNSVTILTPDKKPSDQFTDMLSTIQPSINAEAAYQEMDARYKGIHETKYPKDLLLLSLISIKGPSYDNLKALLKIVTNIHDKRVSVDAIEQEIHYSEGSRK